MTKYKQLILGIIIGILVTATISYADEIQTYMAELASFPVLVDGKTVNLDMPAVTINDRTYLPLRAMGDVLGVSVNWNTEKQQVEIGKEKKMMEEDTNKDLFITINGKEYINILGVDRICSKNNYILSWQGGNDATQWFTLQSSEISDMQRDQIIGKLNLQESDVKGLTTEEIKIKYGLVIYSKTLSLFPDYSEFPYMTRAEYEHVVLPFMSK
ncbi:MAG: hypothetical protein BWY15_01594 [Firmicutes bacterium ADurb.Bin193]|nr:MAG: hypothetical protein BWY15_01594 [Firmicutes bacterium ADurb.Bin193]